MPVRNTAATAPQGEVTFRGRGHGIVDGTSFVLLICPLCSQRNAHAAAVRGHCQWCGYVPSLTDAEARLTR